MVTREHLLNKWGIENKQKVGSNGFVYLVDFMGDDAAIVQAARTSYGAGTKQVNEDRGLIRYLMRHYHSAPLEMCEVKFHIRLPMDINRQLIRHRTASVNEYSTRYSEAIDECHEIKSGEWRTQSSTNKQGSAGFVPNNVTLDPELANSVSKDFYEDIEECLKAHGAQDVLCSLESETQQTAWNNYQAMLAMGVSREMARKNLTLSTYTELYWKIDLHNLFHFLRLRLDSHAQQEIREFAEAMANIVKDLFPIAWEAFVDYRLEAKSFSRMEIEALKIIIQKSISKEERQNIMSSVGIDNIRERKEFWSKLDVITRD